MRGKSEKRNKGKLNKIVSIVSRETLASEKVQAFFVKTDKDFIKSFSYSSKTLIISAFQLY